MPEKKREKKPCGFVINVVPMLRVVQRRKKIKDKKLVSNLILMPVSNWILMPCQPQCYLWVEEEGLFCA